MSNLSTDTIVITALGMCSPFGGVVSSCAAARAGMSGRTEFNDFLVRDEDEVEDKPFVHFVPTIEGFREFARPVILAWNALEDLLAQDDIRLLDAGRTGLFLCISGSECGAERSLPSDVRALVSERLLQLARLPIAVPNRFCVAEGRVGFARALTMVIAALRANEYDRCLLGGADSLVDIEVLESLAFAGRLKTPTRQDGIEPGEAGAFILLEREGTATRRGAVPLAIVGQVVIAEEHVVGSGRALVDAIVLAAGRITDAWLVSDHNGESSCAVEWGNAIVRLSATNSALFKAPNWMPAAHFGDTGAASGLLGACLAARAWVRGYAPSKSALLVSAGEGTLRSVAVFEYYDG